MASDVAGSVERMIWELIGEGGVSPTRGLLMRIASVVALLAAVAPGIAAQNTRVVVPGVDVWISNPREALVHNAPIAAHAVADPEAYIVVFRVTPDNRIVVIKPRTPYGAYRVPKDGLRSEGVDVSFRTEQIDGVGYLFAAASYTPFDFSHIRSDGGWDTERLGAAPHTDALEVADWFVQQIVSSRNTPYGVNDVAYYVGVTPPMDASSEGQQNAQQYGSQSTSVYITPGYNDPFYYDQYGYSVYTYPPATYPYTPLDVNNFYWSDPYAGHTRSGHVKRCPDGTVLPVKVACPVLLDGGHPREGSHKMVPRKPTPPHLLPPLQLRRSPSPVGQDQQLAPAPLLSPSALDRRPRPHEDHPAAPRQVPVGVYNRPILHAPAAAPAPRSTQPLPQPTQPNHTASQQPSQRR